MDRTDTWKAYADDIADKSMMREGGTVAQLEEDASTTMQLLEGAAGFAGLLVNVPKTEAMGCGTQRPGSNRSQAWRERAQLSIPGRGRLADRDTGELYHGWIADAKWSEALGVEDSIQVEVLRLETAFPAAKARVMVLDWREGVEGEQAMTAYVAEDLSAPTLSDGMIRRRDQWIPDLPNWERKRLVYRMQIATTPAAAWRHVLASIERDTVLSRAHTKRSFLAAIEAEKRTAKSSSTPSIHDPAPRAFAGVFAMPER
jgi:hypothetical protein